jgi:hypothetical protein
VETTLDQSEIADNSECKVCGEHIEEPLLAELHSGSIIEEYYACPRCLTKVGEVEHERKTERDEALDEEAELPMEVEEPVIVETEKSAETQGCPYYMGYLKKRQKGTAIPEGCLTCTQMIDCM